MNIKPAEFDQRGERTCLTALTAEDVLNVLMQT